MIMILILCACGSSASSVSSGAGGAGSHQAPTQNAVEAVLESRAQEEDFNLLAATESLAAESLAAESLAAAESLTANPGYESDIGDPFLTMGTQQDTGSEAVTMDPEEIASMAANPEEGIDIDLTQLPSVMIYSQVYEIVYAPEDYVGKKIRMHGTYSSFYDEATDTLYNACIIQDALACCAQGIEFILTDSYQYPDDYPKEGEEITVTGTFDIYEEEGLQFNTLRDSELTD